MTKEMEIKLKDVANIIKQEQYTTPYITLTNEIIKRIGLGILIQGDRLPNISDMAAFAQIGRQTAYKTYQTLQDKGYILMQRQAGATIATPPDKKHEIEICESKMADIIINAYASGLNQNDIHLCLDKMITTIDIERNKNDNKFKDKYGNKYQTN